MPENLRLATAAGASSALTTTTGGSARLRLAGFVVLIAIGGSVGSAYSSSRRPAPLPPPRPGDLAREAPAAASERPPAVSAAAVPPSSCLAALRASGATAESVAQPGGGETKGCAIDEPVRVSAVAVGGKPVALPDRPIVACRFAVRLAEWLGGTAGSQLAATRAAPLRAVTTGPGHECRGRNRQAGAKLSAHAGGLAIDVAGFAFGDGSVLSVASGAASADEGFQALRKAACVSFTTVLGPGSDRFHADHLHVDLQPHGASGRYRICQ